MANEGKTRYDLERNIGKFGDRSMTRRESKRREKFRSIFRGERGALSTDKTNHDCVSIATEKPRFRSVFTSPVGVRGRQGKIGGPGKQSHGYVSARGLKIRSIPRFLRFFSTVESKPRDPI